LFNWINIKSLFDVYVVLASNIQSESNIRWQNIVFESLRKKWRWFWLDKGGSSGMIKILNTKNWILLFSYVHITVFQGQAVW